MFIIVNIYFVSGIRKMEIELLISRYHKKQSILGDCYHGLVVYYSLKIRVYQGLVVKVWW